MKSYGRKPTTSQGKKLSLAHLELQIKIDKQKIKEHNELAKKGIDVAYNEGHVKNHKKDVKDRQKYLKKARKLKVKADKK
jgi:hypothetical protein